MKDSVALSGVGQIIHTLSVEEDRNHSSSLQHSRIVVKENKGYICVTSNTNILQLASYFDL